MKNIFAAGLVFLASAAFGQDLVTTRTIAAINTVDAQQVVEAWVKEAQGAYAKDGVTFFSSESTVKDGEFHRRIGFKRVRTGLFGVGASTFFAVIDVDTLAGQVTIRSSVVRKTVSGVITDEQIQGVLKTLSDDLTSRLGGLVGEGSRKNSAETQGVDAEAAK